jgi:hypothetical protein
VYSGHWDPFVAACQETDTVINMHIGSSSTSPTRMDYVWRNAVRYGELGMLPDPPNSYARGRIYGCVFDDVAGLVARDRIGMGQIMFETDYPHTDGTYPNSAAVAERLIGQAGLNDQESLAFLRGNAIECYKLDKYFGVERHPVWE